MKFKLYLSLFLMIFSVYSPNMHAAPAIQNKVVFVGVNNNDTVFVELEVSPNEPGCAVKQLAIPSDSNIKDKILSIALTAKASNSTITVRTNGCLNGHPSILKHATEGGYFYIQ